MMTPREHFKTEIERSQRLLKRGAIMTLIGFPLVCIIGPGSAFSPRLGWLILPAVIFTFWGFLAWVYSVARLRARVVCPSCGKSLSYLLTNPSYSKQFVQFGIPSDLPEGIAACPGASLIH